MTNLYHLIHLNGKRLLNELETTALLGFAGAVSLSSNPKQIQAMEVYLFYEESKNQIMSFCNIKSSQLDRYLSTSLHA